VSRAAAKVNLTSLKSHRSEYELTIFSQDLNVDSAYQVAGGGWMDEANKIRANRMAGEVLNEALSAHERRQPSLPDDEQVTIDPNSELCQSLCSHWINFDSVFKPSSASFRRIVGFMFHDVYASDLSGQIVNGLSGYRTRIQHASRNHLIRRSKEAHRVTDAFGIYAKDKHGRDPSLQLQRERAQDLLINEQKYIHDGKVVDVRLHNLRGTLTDIDIL
jgi:hypothetical protein